MGRHSARFTVTDRSQARRKLPRWGQCTAGSAVVVSPIVVVAIAAAVTPGPPLVQRLPRLAAPAPQSDVLTRLPGPITAEVVGPSTVRPSLRLTELRVAAVAAVRPLVTPEATRELARRDIPVTAAAEPKRDTSKPVVTPAKPVQPKLRLWPRPKPQPDPDPDPEQNPGGEESNSGGGEPTSGDEENNGGGNSGGEHTDRSHPVRDLVKHVISKAKDSKSKRKSGDSDE